MMTMHAYRLRTVLLLVVVALVSCKPGSNNEANNGSQNSDYDESDFEIRYECLTSSINERDARPLEQIEVEFDIDEIDDELAEFRESLSLRVDYPAYGDFIYIPIWWDEEEDTWAFVAPPYPDWQQGGNVTVRLSGDGFLCDPIPLEIEPLEPAPGTFEKVVDLQDQVAQQQAALLGIDIEKVRNMDFAEMPIMLIPTAVGLQTLNAEDNPNSLAKIARGESEIDFSPGVEMIDALLAEAEYDDHLQSVVDDYRGAEPLPDDFGWQKRSSFVTRQSALECTAAIQDALYPPMSISARTLSNLMQQAHLAGKNLNNRPRKVLETMTTFADSQLFEGNPYVKGANTVVKGFLWVHGHHYGFVNSAYPSLLFNGRVKATHLTFEEDWSIESSEDGAHATYFEYLVDAQSKSWKIGEQMMGELQGLLASSLGNRGKEWLAKSWAKGWSPTGEATEEAVEAAGELFDGTKVNDAIDEISNHATKKLAKELGDGKQCNMPSITWKGIDLTKNIWSRVFYLGSITEDDSMGAPEEAYKPKSTGAGTLRIQARGTAFPPAANEVGSEAEKEIEVKEIKITFDPEQKVAQPGESFEVTLKVENALDKDVELEVTQGVAEVMKEPSNGIQRENPKATISIDIDQPEDELVIVKAKSTSQYGLCAGGKCSNRTGYGFYKSNFEIVINPKVKCLKSDDPPFTFKGDIIGRENDDDIVWTNTDGPNTGTVTPSSKGKGTYTVRAYYEEMVPVPGEPGMTRLKTAEDTATLSIDECDCEWNVQLSGPLSGSWGKLNSVAAAGTSDSLNVSMQDMDTGFFGVIMGPQTWTPKGVGFYPAYFGGEMVLDGNLFDHFQSPEIGEMNVEDLTETRVVVSYAGPVLLWGPSFAREEAVFGFVQARADVFLNDTDNIFSFVNLCGGEITYDGSGLPFAPGN